jgi:formate hydrogenlyase regulatory protein HycA
VLHTFDKKGKHLNTEAWFAGTTASGERKAVEKAQAKLDEMVAALGKAKYGNIKVGLFQVQIDGHTFGLVDASEPDEGYESIHLLPNDLAFFKPWDGNYDT